MVDVACGTNDHDGVVAALEVGERNAWRRWAAGIGKTMVLVADGGTVLARNIGAQYSAWRPAAASPVTEVSMQEHQSPLPRRTMLGGAATAGAAAVVASLMPLSPQAPVAPAQEASGPAEPPAGYQITEHVKSYYAKARI
jgi:hypothetical protein